jgi:hypothetical protein
MLKIPRILIILQGGVNQNLPGKGWTGGGHEQQTCKTEQTEKTGTHFHDSLMKGDG